MNKIKKLQFNINALIEVAKTNNKFFAPIISYINQFRDAINKGVVNVEELEFLILKIEDFYQKYRPSNDPNSSCLYIPPKETSNTDSIVKKIIKIIDFLKSYSMEEIKNLCRENYPQKENETFLGIIDQQLINACKNSYESKDYWDFVFKATRHLEIRVRNKAGLEATDTGTDLINKAFNPKNGILMIPSCATTSEEEGFFQLLRGIIMFHRNAKGHREGSIKEERALQIVHYVDYLIDNIKNSINRKK